jgi:hypothetical protein
VPFIPFSEKSSPEIMKNISDVVNPKIQGLQEIESYFKIGNLFIVGVVPKIPRVSLYGCLHFIGVLLGDEPQLITLPNKEIFSYYMKLIRPSFAQISYFNEHISMAIQLGAGREIYYDYEYELKPTWTDEAGILTIDYHTIVGLLEKRIRFAQSANVGGMLQKCKIVVDANQDHVHTCVDIGLWESWDRKLSVEENFQVLRDEMESHRLEDGSLPDRFIPSCSTENIPAEFEYGPRNNAGPCPADSCYYPEERNDPNRYDLIDDGSPLFVSPWSVADVHWDGKNIPGYGYYGILKSLIGDEVEGFFRPYLRRRHVLSVHSRVGDLVFVNIDTDPWSRHAPLKYYGLILGTIPRIVEMPNKELFTHFFKVIRPNPGKFETHENDAPFPIPQLQTALILGIAEPNFNLFDPKLPPTWEEKNGSLTIRYYYSYTTRAEKWFVRECTLVVDAKQDFVQTCGEDVDFTHERETHVTENKNSKKQTKKSNQGANP